MGIYNLVRFTPIWSDLPDLVITVTEIFGALVVRYVHLPSLVLWFFGEVSSNGFRPPITAGVS